MARHVVRSTARHVGLLGTVIEVSAEASTSNLVVRAQQTVVSEIERLQKVFDSFDRHSDLRRWLDGRAAPTTELATVLELAESWRLCSGGAFDPAVPLLTDAWTTGADRERAPTLGELKHLVATIAAMDRPTTPTWTAPAGPYGLNAIAKGWIVDRALDSAWVDGSVESLTVDAGGDLAHRGPVPIAVGIEDPARPFDNVKPLLAVRVGDQALATSGGARRGWTIRGRWYPHVLDPRSGQPVQHHHSISVLASDTATADVVATVGGVLSTEEALSFVDDLDHVCCVIVTSDGAIRRSRGWAAVELR